LNGRHGGRRAGAGRPTGSVNRTTADLRQLAQQFGAAVIQRLAEMAGLVADVPAAQTETARITAMSMLLDRGYGRATLPLASDPERPISIEFTWQPATPQSQGDVGPTVEGQPVVEAERRALELVWEQDGER
jgi:hypothetical protein